MTTDPFTTADDRWDESPHHLADHCEHAGVGKACRRCRRKFDASAQWARAHLAARTLPDLAGGCACTVHEQDAGGGYTEHLTEYEPACPEHSEHVYNPRTGAWEPTAQEPTDAEVETAARALLPLITPDAEEDAHPDAIDDAWNYARAALSAASAARRDEEKR